MCIRRSTHPRKLCCSCQRETRRGVAAVEAAVALPLLILLVFGTIEVASGIFLTQTLSVAAYEGAREAARPGGTAEQARDRITNVLTQRGVSNFAIEIEPTISGSTPRGTRITVEVRAPMSAFVEHSVGILAGRTSSRRACMVRH